MRCNEGTLPWRALRQFVPAGLLALVLIVGGGAAVQADEQPTFSVVFPAGLACAGFDLEVDGFGDGQQVFRTFTDRDGNVVRRLSAGTGFALVLTNGSTGETLSLDANGAVARTTLNPDGSRTEVLTGHNIIILFPTDDPAGPSTTLHVGRVVYDVDVFGNFTVRQHTGTALDICAALGA